MLKRNILCTIEYCGWYWWYGETENWPITHCFNKHLQTTQVGSGTNLALRRILQKTKRRNPLHNLITSEEVVLQGLEIVSKLG